MSEDDKDGVIQVLCNKDIITDAKAGEPNDTCNGGGRASKKEESALVQVEGFLQEKAQATKQSLVELINEMREGTAQLTGTR